MPWCPPAPVTGQRPPRCREDPRLLVSSGPSLLQSPPTLGGNSGALRGLRACRLWEDGRSMLSCCAVLLWDTSVISAKKKINWAHSLLSRSFHSGPHRSGRTEGHGAGGEKAVCGSVLGGKQLIFCCCLFALAFVFTCYLLGPVVFLILSNLDFSNYAYLVHPHSAAVV